MAYTLKTKALPPFSSTTAGVLAHVRQLEARACAYLQEGEVTSYDKAFALCEYLDLCDQIPSFNLNRGMYNGSVQGLSVYLSSAESYFVKKLLGKSWAAQAVYALIEKGPEEDEEPAFDKKPPEPRALAA
jgi:hypothetical protein